MEQHEERGEGATNLPHKICSPHRRHQAVASFLKQFFSGDDLQSFFTKFDTSLEGSKPVVVGPNEEEKPGVEAMLGKSV